LPASTAVAPRSATSRCPAYANQPSRGRPPTPSGRCTIPRATGAWSAPGPVPQPGGINLAHKGGLFLEEMPDFNRKTLEFLRQPLEDRVGPRLA
jgi:hypothetical protein